MFMYMFISNDTVFITSMNSFYDNAARGYTSFMRVCLHFTSKCYETSVNYAFSQTNITAFRGFGTVFRGVDKCIF